VAAALLPATGDLFADRRHDTLDGNGIAFKALVAVPVGTVLLEEVAFRGVLLALLARTGTTARAVVLFTALAGVVLCLLRLRSGSLLPPTALHWAANALGHLVSYLLR
jgi:membrane protease YdiL (CAAX protease family)